jgi:glycosyltransferase involved in cell wall biosynthesis
MKIKLLFVNESLLLAGGEKSLIALLSKIDREKYEIDLQLFSYGGALDGFIPNYVTVLPEIPYTKFAANSWFQNIFSLTDFSKIFFFISKLKYSLKLRRRSFNHPEKAQLYWEAIGEVIDENPKQYDVAIAYAQGIPTFYVMDKIKAKKKIAWINAKPNFPKRNLFFQSKYYKNYDLIVSVSKITSEQVSEIFPNYKHKLEVITDILDYNSIKKMAEIDVVRFDENIFNILTVARLNYKSKRYDIALEACNMLKNKGVKFQWYVLGEGSYRVDMEKYIIENKLEDYFTFLGTKANPYPYFKAADLYVQTSEFESFGISIAEARLLNIPIVTTRFDTVYMQMVDGKNGLVVDLNATAVADAIERMIYDKDLYTRIVEYLKQEEKENYASVHRFNALVKKLLD